MLQGVKKLAPRPLRDTIVLTAIIVTHAQYTPGIDEHVVIIFVPQLVAIAEV